MPSFPGLSLSSLKKHKALIPLHMFTAAGMTWAFFYLARLCYNSENARWFNKKEGHAWELTGINQQRKFYSPIRDYSKEKFPDERPDISEYSKKLMKEYAQRK